MSKIGEKWDRDRLTWRILIDKMKRSNLHVINLVYRMA